ncbi:hypothetical protein [Brevundimonas sp. FT23042]|uniref:hypothetical protein n=1 Tax=Brevundimonas sp. FT23042 TaxID=3393749 RepID=UPI003B5899C1
MTGSMMPGLAALAAVVLGGGAAQEADDVQTFGAWEVRHFHNRSGPSYEHGARASLLTRDGFISVECRRQGEATLLVGWQPNARLGGLNDYEPREVTVRWDRGPASVEPWEAFVGGAWKRDDAYARAFADRLGVSSAVTLATADERGRRQERTYRLGPAADTEAAMARVQEDCRRGWH